MADDDALVVAMAARAGHHPERPRAITALGNPDRVAELLTGHSRELLHAAKPLSVSTPPGTWERLPEELRARWDLPRRGRWDWMWTEQEPPHLPHEHRVVQLDPTADREAIKALQEAALPGTHFGPERPGSHWFGIWHDQGHLAAVAGAYDWVHAAHLGGIGTHPDLRGFGLGGSLTAAVTRAGVKRFGVVSLGVYADNLGAKALYGRLGYAVGHQVDSRHPAS
ncbi:MAG TPA: GNAT family N-acetyltransferase [Beutenbergiaceae bacterium]|nr:GNAT family N-acetyltransferase [Beutenbergiaceae bacterium]